jgi:small subunit ribosomal protein S16
MRAHQIEEHMVRIRLRRAGRKNAPVFRIVVADSQSPRDGRFVEVIGQYSPREGATDGTRKGRLVVRTDRANYWLDVGAQPSDTVRSLLRRAGVLKVRHESRVARRRQATAVPLPDEQSGGAPARS